MSFCVAGVALCDIPTCLITCGKYQNWRKSPTKCWFFCIHVSCLESLVFLWRRGVYGGSGKTSPIRMCPIKLSCRFAWQAWHLICDIPTCLITCGKYQNWRKSRTKCWFFCIHVSFSSRWLSCGVAVSMGEAGKPDLFECSQAGCYTLHTLHFTLLTPHSTLYTPHSFALFTPHSTLYTSHFPFHDPSFTLRTSHSTLSTPHSTLNTLHSTLHTLHSWVVES